MVGLCSAMQPCQDLIKAAPCIKEPNRSTIINWQNIIDPYHSEKRKFITSPQWHKDKIMKGEPFLWLSNPLTFYSFTLPVFFFPMGPEHFVFIFAVTCKHPYLLESCVFLSDSLMNNSRSEIQSFFCICFRGSAQ